MRELFHVWFQNEHIFKLITSGTLSEIMTYFKKLYLRNLRNQTVYIVYSLNLIDFYFQVLCGLHNGIVYCLQYSILQLVCGAFKVFENIYFSLLFQFNLLSLFEISFKIVWYTNNWELFDLAPLYDALQGVSRFLSYNSFHLT